MLRLFDNQIEGIELVQRSTVGRILVQHKTRGMPALATFGQGMQAALALALGVSKARGGVLLLDELEVGIHNSLLVDVLDKLMLARGVGPDSRQMAFAMHREAKIPDAIRVATTEAVGHLGGYMFLILLSQAIGGVIERSEIIHMAPAAFDSPWAAMAFMSTALVLLGMFMEPLGAIFLVSGTLAPLAYNSGITRRLERFLVEHEGSDIRISVVGKKGREYLKRRKLNVVGDFTGVDPKTVQERAVELNAHVVAQVETGAVDAVATFTVGSAYIDGAPALVLPREQLQPFASFEVGVGW